MRGVLRWLRRVALTALALAVLGVVAALITAHTGWGREQLRRRIEGALRDAFPGGARVAGLDGSVLGTLTLHDVELDGRDRGPLITAGALHVRIALWPLVVRTARFDAVAADDLRVFVRDQPTAAEAAPARAAEPSPWQVELRDVAVHLATVEIEHGGIALRDLDVAGAAFVDGGRVGISGAVRGRWSRAGGPDTALTVSGSAVLDGEVRILRAQVTLGAAVIVASGLVLDPAHPAGVVSARAPAAMIAALAPELAGVVPGDVDATIELAPDGPATSLTLDAAAGDARLWAALHGEPADLAARGVVAATGIDLERVTRGRIHGHGGLVAALGLGADHARGVVLAAGALAEPDLPIRRVAAVMFGDLHGATALVLGGGDGDLALAAAARAHHRDGALVLDDARAALTAHAITLPVAGAADPAPRCRRITGALAASARIAGTLGPQPDLVVTGVAEGTRVTVEPDVRTGCVALAVAPAGVAKRHDATRVSIAALRSPFVLSVTPAGAAASGAGPQASVPAARSPTGVASAGDPAAIAGRPASTPAGRSPSPPSAGALDAPSGLEVSVAGEVAVRGLAYDDVTVGAASGSFALGVAPEARLDAARAVATGIHRAGRLLG
ncbi:MAG TPA: hypothetical protein VGD37_21885, partial [Kofleriaceae bacterium]